MKLFKDKRFVVGGLVVLLAAVAYGQTKGISVTLDGTIFSNRGRVINGTLYAPVTDFARVYGLKLDYKPGQSTARLGAKAQETRFQTEGKIGDWVAGRKVAINFSLETAPATGATLIRGEIRNGSETSYNLCFKSVTLVTQDGKRIVMRARNVMNSNDEGTGGSYLVLLKSGEVSDFVLPFPGEGLVVNRIVAVVTTANTLFQETFRLSVPTVEPTTGGGN